MPGSGDVRSFSQNWLKKFKTDADEVGVLAVNKTDASDDDDDDDANLPDTVSFDLSVFLFVCAIFGLFKSKAKFGFGFDSRSTYCINSSVNDLFNESPCSIDLDGVDFPKPNHLDSLFIFSTC